MAITKLVADSLGTGVGGKVLQVVQSSTTTQVVNTTSTYSDTTLTASITPSSSSNKILILICQSIQWYSTSAGGSAKWQLLRDATVIYEPTPTAETLFSYDYGGSGLNLYFNNPLDYLDTPSTTSSVTYKTRIAIGAYGGNQANAQYNNNKSFITLMEIAG